MADIAILEAELAKLVAANEAATSWGAAVGAREERIKNIHSELRRLRAPSSPAPATIAGDELSEIYRLLHVREGESALDILRAHPDWQTT